MEKSTTESNVVPFQNEIDVHDELTSLLKEGVRQLLQVAIESEGADYIDKHKSTLDNNGHRMLVRNGHHPERNIQTGLGPIPVKKPKVNDKRFNENDERIRFDSEILPAYLKRTGSIEELVPWLYLRGISTGGFPQALEALLGKHAQDCQQRPL